MFSQMCSISGDFSPHVRHTNYKFLQTPVFQETSLAGRNLLLCHFDAARAVGEIYCIESNYFIASI